MSKIAGKQILTLDSDRIDLSLIEDKLQDQLNKLEETLVSNQKILQQQKITNLYKASENDFVIDDNIFDEGDNV